MSTRLLSVIVGSLMLALAAGPAGAQARRWAEPYQRGERAVKDGRYLEGIPLLEEAISVDRRQARVKQTEGTFPIEYYPFYYLGVAYLRTNQLEKAEQAFREAKTCRCLTGTLSKLMAVHEADLASKIEAAANKPKPDPAPVGPGPAFVRQLNEADAAVSAGRFADAIRLFDALRALDAGEYAKRNLAGRRSAAEAAQTNQLVRQADQLLASGALGDARARYQEAETLSPGRGRAGLDEIRRRQDEYTGHKSGAQADHRAGRIQAALEKLASAERADPEQYRAENLAALAAEWGKPRPTPVDPANRASEMVRRGQAQVTQHQYREAAASFRLALSLEPGNADARTWLDGAEKFEKLRDAARLQSRDRQFEAARQSLDDARRIDQERFVFEKLDELLTKIDEAIGTFPEAQIAPVRTALVAYLKGDPAEAVRTLEPLAAGGDLDPRIRAHVFAYLGAAYSDMSMVARADAERTDLKQKALDLFTRLIALQPEYQLRESLISPRVRELLEQARTRR